MILPKTTMIINISISYAINLRVANEVFDLSQINIPSEIPLSGASWISSERASFETFSAVFKSFDNCVKKRLSRFRLWLIVGTVAWQSNTRVVRHYGLWGSLLARGLRSPELGHQRSEKMKGSSERVKFFGTFRISPLSAYDAVNILLSEECAYIVALPEDNSPNDFLTVGWTGSLNSDGDLLSTLININALLVKKVGEFDDPEVGLLTIGSPHLIESLVDKGTTK
jgi:hypothetical protein